MIGREDSALLDQNVKNVSMCLCNTFVFSEVSGHFSCVSLIDCRFYIIELLKGALDSSISLLLL